MRLVAIIIIFGAVLSLFNLLRPGIWIDRQIGQDAQDPKVKNFFNFNWRLAIAMPILVLVAAVLFFVIAYWLGPH